MRSHCGEVQVLNPMPGTHVRRTACGQVRNSKNEFAIEDSEVEPDTKTAVVQNRTVSAHAQGQSRCKALQILLSVPIPDITQVPAHGVTISQSPRIQASGRPDFLIISVGRSDRIAGSAMNARSRRSRGFEVTVFSVVRAFGTKRGRVTRKDEGGLRSS